MAIEESEFASRHVNRWSDSDRTRDDFQLPGWSPRSTWGAAGEDHWVLLREQARPSRAVEWWAEPAGAGNRVLLVPSIVEKLDVEPEDVVRAMGTAMPYPVLRSASEMSRALARHVRVDGDPHAAGPVAPLEWLLGGRSHRPGSGRVWAGGEPGPRQVEAEEGMCSARLLRGDLELGAPWLTGARDRLRWSLVALGPLNPEPGEWQRWWHRRRHGDPDLPIPDLPGPACRIGRGRRFRSRQVVNGLLGSVEPVGRWRRWVATNHRGGRISDRVHCHLPDAAFEVAVEAFRAGRSRADPDRSRG